MEDQRGLLARDETQARTDARDRSRALDGLRGLTALAVVVAHTSALPSSAYGDARTAIVAIQLNTAALVLLFFCISGYLISGPYLRALVAGTPLPDPRTYAVRRAARIFPAYWVAFAGLFVLGVTSPSDVDPYQWPVHLGLLHSSWPVADESTAVFAVAWTLGIEFAFYVFVPIAAWVLRKLKPGPWRVDHLVALVLVGALATILWPVYSRTHSYVGIGGGLRVNGLYNWLFAFTPGMLLALAALARPEGPVRHWLRVAQWRAAVYVVAALIWTAGYALIRSSTPELRVLSQPTWVLASGLLLGTVLSGPSSGLRGLKLLAPAGLTSYGIYLWHTLVVDWLVRHPGLTVQGFLGAYAVDLVIVLIATAPFAVASWLLIERPCITWAARWVRTHRPASAQTTAPPTKTIAAVS